MPRRILFIEATCNGVVGGSVVSLYDLVIGLNRERYEPCVVLYSDLSYRKELEKHCKVIVLPRLDRVRRDQPGVGVSRRWTLWHSLLSFIVDIMPRTFALCRIIWREKIDILHNNNSHGQILEGILAAKLTGIPCVVHQRAIEKVYRLSRFLSRYVDVMICISEAVRQYYLAENLPVKRIVRVYSDGVDFSKFVPSLPSETVRSSLGLKYEWPVVGIVGTVQPWKGQREVILAVDRLRDKFPELQCLVVGGVYDSGYYTEIKILTETLGLQKNAHFLGHRDDIANLMNAMDVVIHASTLPEPFGRVLIEAMAVGTPLIATKAGGPLEIMEDHVTGLLVPPRDPEAIVKAVTLLLEDRDLAVKMVEAGQQRVEELFDLKKTIAGVERVYESIF